MKIQQQIAILLDNKPDSWTMNLNTTTRGFIEVKILRPDKSIALEGDIFEEPLIKFIEVLKAMKSNG